MAKVARNPASTLARSQSSRGPVADEEVVVERVFMEPPSIEKRLRWRATWGPNWEGLYQVYESFTESDSNNNLTERACCYLMHNAGHTREGDLVHLNGSALYHSR